MSLALVALSLFTASTAVRLDYTVDLPLQTSRELALAFTTVLGEHLGERAILDDPDWASCESEGQCLAAVRRALRRATWCC